MSGLSTAGAALHSAWGRTVHGWALNLDGSAASGFALPRLEIEQGEAGWLCRCRFADGTSREVQNHAPSIAVAQRAAAELARGRIAGECGTALANLLAS
jgi:hypothetical protein